MRKEALFIKLHYIVNWADPYYIRIWYSGTTYFSIQMLEFLSREFESYDW